MVLRLTKTHVEKAGYWVPTLAGYGTTAVLGLLYFTDWKLVLQYVPIYNKKFEEKKLY